MAAACDELSIQIANGKVWPEIPHTVRPHRGVDGEGTLGGRPDPEPAPALVAVARISAHNYEGKFETSQTSGRSASDD